VLGRESVRETLWPPRGRSALLSLRHHPHRRRLRGRGYFKRLGPGLVTGAADDDPSGIGTYSQVGAAYGFSIVWSTLWVAPMAAAVQETAARLGLATGEGLSTLIRRRFPRVVLLGAVALVAVANTFNIAADLASMGAAAQLVVPIPQTVLVASMTALMLGLEIAVAYHRYARILRWLALSLVAYVLVLLMVEVDWGTVLRDLIVPSLTGDRAELAALIAVFGTTVSPYLFFWQTSEEVEETADDSGPPDLGEDHLRAMRIDVIGGMLSAVAVAFAIMVAAAATLHRHGIAKVQTAEQAARALKPVAGDLAGLVFALGIVGLGLLAVPVLAGSTAYALSDAVGWNEGLSKRFRDARGFYDVIIVSMLLGLLLDFAGLDPIRGLYYAAILNGVTAPPLIVLMLLLARSRHVMGDRRSGRLSTTILVITIAVSTILPVAYLLS
jgi:NRAMP (natural resistance-associated macrophage protein)-like metal ion transporter